MLFLLCFSYYQMFFLFSYYQIQFSVESLSAVSRDAQKQAAGKKRRARRSAAEEEEKAARVIKMRLEATIGSLGVAIGTEKSLDTWIAIENVSKLLNWRIPVFHRVFETF